MKHGLKPSPQELDQLVEAGGDIAHRLINHAAEMWLLAARLEDELEAVAPGKLEGLRRSLYFTAKSSGHCFPYWSANRWTPPAKEAA